MIQINDIEIKAGVFPDGTLKLLDLPILDYDDNMLIWFYENDAELFTIYCLKQHYRDVLPTLYMPYCPNARMDRVKTKDECFTLKYFADFINLMNFNKVIIRDPHSNITTALINNCWVETVKVPVETVLREHIKDKDVVIFYPDEGAMKRYSELINKPYIFGVKHRDWKSGEIKGLQIMGDIDLKNKTVLIVDDICSYGGTFKFASEALHELGAKDIQLFVTHAERNMLKGDMYKSDLVSHIYTTLSIFGFKNEGKVTIVK